MADYRSTLTGTQMDAALLDMAEHNSEAYAVGERNGIAVASDDATYHNNARYYAQIASSQIVGDASSAVRWDTDQSEVLTDAQKARARENINAASDSDVVKITAQTLTSAQQAQARANIMAGGSNRNLLDNPFFTAGNVVNQRGVATIPHKQYGIDRWKGELGSATITVTDAGLAYQGTSADIYQLMESALRTFLNGKTLTASVLKSDGTIESGSAVFTNGAKTQFIYNSETGGDVFISAAGNFNLRYLNRTSATTVVAAKLELGSISTLANDVPPNYAEELAKCQRYFVRLKSAATQDVAATLAIALAGSTTTARAVINLPTTLNAKTVASYVLSYSGIINLVEVNNSTSHVVSSVFLGEVNENSVFLKFDATGLTAGSNYFARVSSGAYIDISADL